MSEDTYEWDADKAAANLRNHGVAFAEAIKAFRDPLAIEWLDDREDYGEQRVNMIGMSEGMLLHLTYTHRGASIRIISARQAQGYEQSYYYRENAR
jgi:uncharacterized DUF497 family protein